MDHDDFLFFLSSNIGKTIEATTVPMAATAEVIIVVMEIVLAAIEIGVVDSAETALMTIVEPVIATAEIASVVIATVVIAIGVVDMAETVSMIGATMIVVTMIAEVASVLVTEIGDVTMMTGSVSEVHGVTVEMQEAILIETRGSQVRE